jgi:hypothetical protein
LRPANTVAPEVTGTTAPGDELSTTDGTWTNSPLSYTYQWRRDGVAISGATANTYTLVMADTGTDVTARVVAINAEGSGSAVSNAVAIPAVAPISNAAPVASGDGEVGETLSCTTGTWLGTAPITYSYQWERDGTPIGGATASTYLVDVADEGTDVTCDVTATNSAGNATESSNAIAVSGGISPPVNSIPPVLAWTVSIGNSPTITPGTWSESPTLTYTLYRDGVADGTEVGRTEAQAEAYVAVAADIGPTLLWRETATNGAGSATSDSNSVTYAHATDLPDSAIGIGTAGLTLADSDTTVQQWDATLGGKSAAVSLSAPASGNRPAYSATGGPSSKPMVTFDGTNDTLRSTAVTMGGTFSAFQLDVVGKLNGAETASDRLLIYGALFGLTCDATPNARGFTTTAAIISTGTTAITGTHRQITFEWDGTSQYIRLNNGAAEDTDASTHAAYADGQSLALGASATGTLATNLDCLGWSFTRGTLTATQKANLSALLQYHTGRP